MSFTIHQCSICQEDLSIGSGRTFISTLQGRSVIPGRTLGCGHSFHNSCINRWLYGGNSSCPHCRQELTPSERDYEMTEDPAPPSGYSRYFSSNGNEHCTAMFTDRVSEKARAFFLNNLESVVNGTLPGMRTTHQFEGSFTTADSGNVYSHVQEFSDLTVVYYTDLNGQHHTDLS